MSDRDPNCLNSPFPPKPLNFEYNGEDWVLYRQASLKYDDVERWSMIQLSSSLSNVPVLGQWFMQFCQPPLPREIWLEANAALIEGYTNAVRHAHRHLSQTQPVWINALLTPENLMFEIWDQGFPFNFEQELVSLKRLRDDPTFNPLDREAHWGGLIFLKLIDQCHWQIDYARYPDQSNCLRAVIQFSQRK
ncbi:MAG: anti-sigma regulatory factor [Acaryochloridaceae cyanobacterium RL_2_7]|nr:anti-sigma regulatory factor [Acaryochloridaceae cyanobacterium RL_2_7]